MAGKREQNLWKSVWSRSKKLERLHSLTAILSGGMVLMDSVPAELREEAIIAAKTDDFSAFEKDFKDLLEDILRERIQPALLQAHKETVEETFIEADDDEVAEMLNAISEMIEKGGGTRVLGPKASAGAQKLRDVLVANFKKNNRKSS